VASGGLLVFLVLECTIPHRFSLFVPGSGLDFALGWGTSINGVACIEKGDPMSLRMVTAELDDMIEVVRLSVDSGEREETGIRYEAI
jgi:hypothetical protein